MNYFVCTKGEKMPLVYKNGPNFVQWKRNILFTQAELRRLHLHFIHTATKKLFNLLGRARPESTIEKLRVTLQQIAEACESCRDFRPPLIRFKASLPPESTTFNHEIAIDVM